jgi:uncharacterized OsmC-like protein
MSSLREYLIQKRGTLFGESPPDLRLGVLESCLTNNFLIQAAVRQVPLDGIEVDLTGLLDPSASSRPAESDTLQYTVKINSPASDAELTELHAAVEEACPPLGRLADHYPISGEIVRTTGLTVNSVAIGARAAVAV